MLLAAIHTVAFSSAWWRRPSSGSFSRAVSPSSVELECAHLTQRQLAVVVLENRDAPTTAVAIVGW
jgi:hypothetical protein